MKHISQELQEPGIGPMLLHLLCYRNQRHNILKLRQIVGDAVFLQLLDQFAGTYTRYPTAKHVSEVIDDLRLAQLFKNMRAAARRDVKSWNDAETHFIRAAQRMGCKYETAIRRARAVIKECGGAMAWLEELRKFDQKTETDL